MTEIQNFSYLPARKQDSRVDGLVRDNIYIYIY